MIRASVILTLALGAGQVATQTAAQTADEVAAMTKAVEDAGCFVTPENGDAVQAASGLDAEQTMAVITQMYTDGTVTLTADGHMKLTNEVCE